MNLYAIEGRKSKDGLNKLGQQIKALKADAKKLPRKAVELMVKSKALENSNKTFAELGSELIEQFENGERNEIAPILNVRRGGALELILLNVSRKKCSVQFGESELCPWSCEVNFGFESVDGPVTADKMEELTLNVRGGRVPLAARRGKDCCCASVCTKWESVNAEWFPFGKAREGLVDVMINMIVDGKEVEERASLLFGPTILTGIVPLR
jgi:hypothetical protein